MEKRALLAVIISLIILVVYQQYFISAPPAPPEPDKENPQQEKVAPPAKEEGGKAVPIPSPPDQRPAEIRVQPGKDITVETPLYAAVFDTRGARLKSWKVKNHMDKIGEGAKPIDRAT